MSEQRDNKLKFTPFINFHGNIHGSSGYTGDFLVPHNQEVEGRKTGQVMMGFDAVFPYTGDCIEHTMDDGKTKRAFYIMEGWECGYNYGIMSIELERHTDLFGRSFVSGKYQEIKNRRGEIEFKEVACLTIDRMTRKKEFPGTWKYTKMPLVLDNN